MSQNDYQLILTKTKTWIRGDKHLWYNIFLTGGKKLSLNWDSYPGPLAYSDNTLTTKLLRPDILTDSHTLVNPVTFKSFFYFILKWAFVL